MVQSAKLTVLDHTRMPWRIHAVANDFRVEDVWSLPTPGGSGDFPRLFALMGSFDPAQSSRIVGALFAIRWRLGSWFGLDRDDAGLGGRVHSLRERLPTDLVSATPAGRDAGGFTLLYETADEAAFEIANRTVHAVLHLGWVPDGDGAHRGQMAVLVKPNGVLGVGYMSAIALFRHAIVYPIMLRELGRLWRAQDLVRQVDVPVDGRGLSTLPSVDYADSFLVDTRAHPARSAYDWVVAVLEEAPPAQRSALLAGWSALGLRAAESGESVLGWEVRRHDEGVVLLGRDSRIGMPGELLFLRRPEGLLFATFVHHDTAATRAMWAGVRRTHVRTVLELLERAARYPAGGGGGASAGGGGGASPGEVGRFGPGDI